MDKVLQRQVLGLAPLKVLDFLLWVGICSIHCGVIRGKPGMRGTGPSLTSQIF